MRQNGDSLRKDVGPEDLYRLRYGHREFMSNNLDWVNKEALRLQAMGIVVSIEKLPVKGWLPWKKS